jgi:hypothetical protein
MNWIILSSNVSTLMELRTKDNLCQIWYSGCLPKRIPTNVAIEINIIEFIESSRVRYHAFESYLQLVFCTMMVTPLSIIFMGIVLYFRSRVSYECPKMGYSITFDSFLIIYVNAFSFSFERAYGVLKWSKAKRIDPKVVSKPEIGPNLLLKILS